VKIVHFQMKPFSNCYFRLRVHLNDDIQQHRIACVHRVVVRWDPCGDVVDDPPGDQIGSINLCAEGPLVVVSMNREVRKLWVVEVSVSRGSGRRKHMYSQDVDRIHRCLAGDNSQKVHRSSNELHTTAQKI